MYENDFEVCFCVIEYCVPSKQETHDAKIPPPFTDGTLSVIFDSCSFMFQVLIIFAGSV